MICLYPFLYQLVTHSGSSICSWMTFSTFSANHHCYLRPCNLWGLCDLSPSSTFPRGAPLLQSLPGTHHPSSQQQESMSLFTNKSCHYSVPEPKNSLLELFNGILNTSITGPQATFPTLPPPLPVCVCSLFQSNIVLAGCHIPSTPLLLLLLFSKCENYNYSTVVEIFLNPHRLS